MKLGKINAKLFSKVRLFNCPMARVSIVRQTLISSVIY